jgi:hypothetical protein
MTGAQLSATEGGGARLGRHWATARPDEMQVEPSASAQKGRFRFLFFLTIFSENKFQKN